MAVHTSLENLFIDIANAIRNKSGSTEIIIADNFPTAINNIPTGINTDDANATASQILTGYSAYAKGTKVNGSMANNGAVSTTLSAGGSYTIPVGYHNGSGIIKAAAASGYKVEFGSDRPSRTTCTSTSHLHFFEGSSITTVKGCIAFAEGADEECSICGFFYAPEASKKYVYIQEDGYGMYQDDINSYLDIMMYGNRFQFGITDTNYPLAYDDYNYIIWGT